MDLFTPSCTNDSIAVVSLSSIETNIFRNYEESIEEVKESKQERLLSYLRIRPIDSYSSKDTKHCLYIQPNPSAPDPSAAAGQSIDCKLVAIAPAASQTFKNTKGQQREVKQRVFEFNRIFDEQSDQCSVYDEAIRPLVEQFVTHHENVLLFAYGTTCSGKTHTIRGTPTEPGVIPRAIVQVFESIRGCVHSIPTVKRAKFNDYTRLSEEEIGRELQTRQYILNQSNNLETNQWIESLHCLSSTQQPSDILISVNQTANECLLIDPSSSAAPSPPTSSPSAAHIRYVAWVSFVELYNESLIDLLQPEPTKAEKSASLKLIRDSNQNFFVNGLRHVFVETAEEAHKVMSYGIANLKKHMSSTGMNSNSSRSHAIFSISLVGLNAYDGVTVRSVSSLSLADLAGTERGKKTGNVGVRMKEAASILKSLFTLKSCISTLRNNQRTQNPKIVAYTESALTKLFQPYLSGFGMTTMVIAINPAPEHYDETIGTLDFSAIASKVVVVKEEARRKIRKDLSRRLTRIWLQSSKNWSTVCRIQSKDPTSLQPHKKNESTLVVSEMSGMTEMSGMSEVSGECASSFEGQISDEEVEEIVSSDDLIDDEEGDEMDSEMSILISDDSSENEASELDVDEIDDIEQLRDLLVGMQDELDQYQATYEDMELKMKVQHTNNMFEHDKQMRQEFERKLNERIEQERLLFEQKTEMIENEYKQQIGEYIEKIEVLKDQLFLNERTYEQKKESFRKWLKDMAWRAFDQQIEDTMMDMMNRLEQKLELDQAEQKVIDLNNLLMSQASSKELPDLANHSDHVWLNDSEWNESDSVDEMNAVDGETPQIDTNQSTAPNLSIAPNQSIDLNQSIAANIQPFVRCPGPCTPIPKNVFWKTNDSQAEDFSSFEAGSLNSIQSFTYRTPALARTPAMSKLVSRLLTKSNFKQKSDAFQSSTIETPIITAYESSNVIDSSRLNETDDELCNELVDDLNLSADTSKQETTDKSCEAKVITQDSATSPHMTEDSEASRKILNLETLLKIRENSYNELLHKFKFQVDKLDQFKKATIIPEESADNSAEQTSMRLDPKTPSALLRFKRTFDCTTEKKRRKRSKGDSGDLCRKYLQTLEKNPLRFKADAEEEKHLDDVGQLIMESQSTESNANAKTKKVLNSLQWESQLKSARKRLAFNRNNSFVEAVSFRIFFSQFFCSLD
jgi:hypothetical protein